ncbi:MAG: undecaprenyl-phosphate glucose phosphotransferase [Bacteroidaceae bacterium]|nr:undecaprenyl-phosphate glucose phosphotransferase [Bacteroidaceae bacterium]
MQDNRSVNKILKYAVIISDLCVLNLLIAFFHFVGSQYWTSHWNSDELLTSFFVYNICYLYCIGIWPPILYFNKVRSDEIVRRVFSSLFWFAVLTIVAFSCLNNAVTVTLPGILFFVILIVLVTFSRLTLRGLLKIARKRGRNTHQVIFVGDGDHMLELYNEMTEDPSYGYRIRGYFNDTKSELYPESIPWLGKLDDVTPYLQSHTNGSKILNLYCGLHSADGVKINQIIRSCEASVVRFNSVPSMRTYLKRHMNMEFIGSMPILQLRREPLMESENRFIKRTFDIFCSSLFLFTIFPFIYLFVAIVIKITSPGPVFFKQKRNGINGKEFYCYKFRSMKVNAQADTLQATEHDPRKTKFGDFMRKTNIDELPQFINVLKGDMSLVGPRPHMVKHTEEYSALIGKYMVRHLIKPGITGWAQVTGCRGETKELYQMEERVKRDIWYVENWSFWLDLRIMYLTVKNMVLRNEKMAY